jgi:hypothetical protein
MRKLLTRAVLVPTAFAGAFICVYLLVSNYLVPTLDLGPDRHVKPHPLQERYDRLAAKYDCSTESVPTPVHAIVQKGDRLVVTSFDFGWRVHNNPSSKAKLIAVCER